MEIGYYVKDQDETIEDLHHVPGYQWDCAYGDTGAVMCAEYAWSYHYGWEWLDGATLTIVIDGKEVGDYEITVGSEPVFYSERKTTLDRPDKPGM